MLPDNEETTTIADDSPLSLSEAVKAFTAPEPEEEADPSQSDADENAAEETAEELPTDEVGEDEGVDQTDDEGAAEEQTEEEPETEQGRFVGHNGRVRLPDGTESTVSDLIQGNLRDRDYRQKTMELAESRKAFEGQSTVATQREQQIEQQRGQLVELLQMIVPPAPDPQLLQSDPMGYMTQRAAHEQWVAHLQGLEAQKQQAEQARQADAAKETEKKIAAEWTALLEKAPDFKDRAKLDGFVADIASHATSYGYSLEEITSALPRDHRQALVLRDALAWRKLQASKPKVLPKPEARPPVLKGGKRLNSDARQARDATAAMDRLNQSGKLKDGVAAYLASQKG